MQPLIVGKVVGSAGWKPATGGWPDELACMHSPPLSCNPEVADLLGIPLAERG